MKNKIFAFVLSALAASAFTACSEDQGTNPGGDSAPVATIYSYATSLPYNPDNDVKLRFTGNDKTNEIYYYAEPTTAFEENLRELGESGYANFVVENGTKLELENNYADVVLTDLYGEYTISAVAINGSQKTLRTTTFLGLDWEDLATGVYYFGVIGLDETETTLQVCTTDPTLYRFKDLFGEGYSIKFTTIDIQGQDQFGVYDFIRVAPQPTPYSNYYAPLDEYGPISLRDVGYWQGNDAFVTEGGYEGGIYKPENGGDYSVFLCLNYYASYSAGTLSLGYDYDEFYPYE